MKRILRDVAPGAEAGATRERERPSPTEVAAVRAAYASQMAEAAYQNCLTERVFPQAVGCDAKARKSAERSLRKIESIALLRYIWLASRYIFPEDVEAAGLEPKPEDAADYITRRGLGIIICDQFGERFHDRFEQQVRRKSEMWVRFGLVTETHIRDNYKQLRATALLHELMCEYHATLEECAAGRPPIASEDEVDG